MSQPFVWIGGVAVALNWRRLYPLANLLTPRHA
jgi:hypothetical protein